MIIFTRISVLAVVVAGSVLTGCAPLHRTPSIPDSRADAPLPQPQTTSPAAPVAQEAGAVGPPSAVLDSPASTPTGESVGTAPAPPAVGQVERPLAPSPTLQRTDVGETMRVGPGAAVPSTATGEADYRIGEEDELDISVYGDADLKKTQTVRPGGKIGFPLIGEVVAAGLTADELGIQMERRLARFLEKPRVTVVITKYNSRKITILGEVKTPGLLRLSSSIDLLEAISRAGGLTPDADLAGALLIRDGQVLGIDFARLLQQADYTQNVRLQANDAVFIPSITAKKIFVLGQVNKPQVVYAQAGLTLVEAISHAGGLTVDADLQGALLLRQGQIMPVSFDKLLRQGDAGQNVVLQPNDTVLIPNINDKKVFVLGEVQKPLATALRPGLTVVESISLAGGFTVDAQPRSVLLIRGGLGDPSLQTIDVKAVMTRGELSRNAALQPGDIVYVPRSFVADVVKFFQNVASILSPIVVAESGIVIGPSVKSILTTGTTVQQGGQPAVVVGGR